MARPYIHIICNKNLTALTKFSLQRHYIMYHIEKYGNVTGENRTECIKKLKEAVFESVATGYKKQDTESTST